METELRTYTLIHAGGQLDIQATSTRDAIRTYQKEYGEDWYSCGPKDPPAKSIVPAGPADALTKANYDRIVADEEGWEKQMRGQMSLSLELLVRTTTKNQEATAERQREKNRLNHTKE